MYEIFKKINDTTFLALKENDVFVLKRTENEELELYNRLSEIRHKNVATVYGTAVIDEKLYAVCEYISGVTLEKYIEQSGLLSDEETKNIALKLCDGLMAIHETGIVHRDIKPGNIVITRSGEPVIIDFGISRLFKSNASTDTYILGTNGYAAPEQFGFSQSTNKTDVYAMGVLINYMKTGCLPAEKLTDGSLKIVVEKCIQIDEEKRYASAMELKSAIVKKRISPELLSEVIYHIPGFRRESAAITAVSAFYYFICALFMIFCNEDKGIAAFFSDRLPLFFILVMPYFLMWDIGSFTSKLGVDKNKNKTSNLIIRIASSLFSLIIAAVLIGVSPAK